ncbi:MAG: GspH/FimT family pseudopilin [Leucothrix sp.]
MKRIIRRRRSGFTLIEALVAISIVSILASIAIPSFTKMLESNRISSASNNFLSALIFARSEAAKRSFSVSICTSSNGSSCATDLDDYASGWIVFVDCENDGDLTTSATTCDFDGDGINDGDLLLRVQEPLTQVSIVATSSATEDSFTYRFSGRPLSVGVGFDVGPDAATPKKAIKIARTGRVRLQNH